MSPTRRNFMIGAGAAGDRAAPRGADRDPSRPTIAYKLPLIGAGGMGTEDALSSLAQEGVSIVAASDVYDGRLTRAKERWGNQVFTSRDYREVLARPDIDAVIVATPDHWHAQICRRCHECRQGRLRREAHGPESRRRYNESSKRSRRQAEFCR